MRAIFPWLLMLALNGQAAEPADAGSPACAQQLLSGLTAWQGALSFTREQGALVLRYQGPAESSVGLKWEMTLAVHRKVLEVTIASSSSSPSGLSSPAEGRNKGTVSLPPLVPGTYRLELRQGAARARYALTLGEDVTLAPLGKVPEGLSFSSLSWRHTPADAALIVCTPRSWCGNEVCTRLMGSELLRALPKVDDGAYLTLANSDSSCVVHLDQGRAAELRAALAGFDDAGCASLGLWQADAGS